MNISVTQMYLEEDAGYPFSSYFQKWLAGELCKRTRPSANFLKRYPGEYTLGFYISAKKGIKAPEIKGPGVYRKTRDVKYTIFIPFDPKAKYERAGYRKPLAWIMDGVVAALKGLEIDASLLVEDSSSLIEVMASDTRMIRNVDSALLEKRKRAVAKGKRAPQNAPPKSSGVPKGRKEGVGKDGQQTRRLSTRIPINMPEWTIPGNLQKLVSADGDGIWEDARWDPVLLTVMGGISYCGRAIPLAWQIEFEPVGDLFAAPNAKIEALGLEPDGYGWATLIRSVFTKYYPGSADELQFGDVELATCVVWVESESTCKLLMQIVWDLIHAS